MPHRTTDDTAARARASAGSASTCAGGSSTANVFATPNRKTPLGLKVFGVLLIVTGAALTPLFALTIYTAWVVFQHGGFNDSTVITFVFFGVLLVLLLANSVLFIVLGIRLIRNKRRGARQTAETVITLLIGCLLCTLALNGVHLILLAFIVPAVLMVAMLTYIDPTLSEERELQRALRDMETRDDLRNGTLGLDKSGEGFIALDFFNLFWIFTIACVIGTAIETVYHFVVVDPGHYQNRTGMLFGPFSPIYGFGAVLMTIALNRFHKANVGIVFLVSAVIGGAFEYAVSWFMQFAFGITAWDYSGTFLNIGGRTNFMFMCMWGALGVVWIKLLLPAMLRIVNLIPWKLRYSVTAVCATLMIVNGAMTLIALDCWYNRLAGIEPTNAVEQFCADHFDNDWMEHRFQSMSINPDNATRAR